MLVLKRMTKVMVVVQYTLVVRASVLIWFMK